MEKHRGGCFCVEGDENVLVLKERWGDVWIRAYT